MKPKEYMFVFILILCLVVSIFTGVRVQNNRIILLEIRNDLKGNFEAITAISNNQDNNITIEGAELAELADKYADMKMDSRLKGDYIRGFAEFLEGEYYFEWHNKDLGAVGYGD